MAANKFELPKSPLFHFKWIGFKNPFTKPEMNFEMRFIYCYIRYANFATIALGPIEVGFRMPWSKYNIWIRGYEEGYMYGVKKTHELLKK